MNISDQIKAFGVNQALKYVEKDPETNLPKLMDWAEKIIPEDELQSKKKAFRKALEEKNNWYDLIMSLYELDEGARVTFFKNFLVNSAILGLDQEARNSAKYNCNVPWAILLDPTSACNLKCIGCWAAEYGNRLNMSYETLDDIIKQAKDLGTYMFIYSGGEPLVRKADIIKLCEAHPDAMFMAFTNGTLIDEAFADEMLRVKNFIPAISLEGFEEATDSRRGKGTYKAVVKAMEILKRKKLPFGNSCCYTSYNYSVIGSDEFFDYMIHMGSKFAWIFTYMPVGKNAVVDLIAKPEHREYMYHQIRKFRKTKPIFTLDFWNDGEYVNGCIAGGRRYLHINANGDIEPCAFIHYSDSNIKEKTLIEAYQFPLFMGYRENQPFNGNHLRPCPLLDNIGALSSVVDKSGAKSTDLENPEDVHELSAKCKDAAANWEPVADRLWESNC